MTKKTMSLISRKGQSLSISSPTAMPLASSFLWNSQMMIQVNCRGYATAQFMQPEPAKYAHAPNLEAKTFMQPEQPYYAHHPGRFIYVKDLDTNALFSAPYEPVRAELDDFNFTAGQHDISWRVVKDDVEVTLRLSLSVDHTAELWKLSVVNLDQSTKKLSITPYFPVGFMSWMNQSGDFNPALNAVICRSVTPYQKYPDYFNNKDFKDLTYFLADNTPDSWDVRQNAFEGEGGLHSPSALNNDSLSNSDAIYETPAATLQYKVELAAGARKDYKFVFGPAKDEAEIAAIKSEFLDDPDGFANASDDYSAYINSGKSSLNITTPDAELDDFVNNWLARQVYYHGDVNRLCTDPQTRNYLQDNMGMSYIKPAVARSAFLLALSQQNRNGAMPDGILLSDEAELKYINQVPHMDHCVWLPVCISAYLDETDDYGLLEEQIPFGDSDDLLSVREHISLAMSWLFEQRDHRGLNFIEQGDWCDPMNMVGYKGKGVSGWLTLATAYASNIWADTLTQLSDEAPASIFRSNAAACNDAVNTHIWSDAWYGRGITDDDVLFGIAEDPEGRIFLNPQSWAILSGAANADKTASVIKAVEVHLETPYGVEMLSPSFTKMRDDIGRVTQKHPGSAENGSVYNHAAAFYVYALYQIQNGDRAYKLMRQMIPGPDEVNELRRGQLPTFIPNYYRGAYRQFERTAGRSSQLFNTGTVHWFYRCLVDGLFGVQGCREGLKIAPQLPSHWLEAQLTRRFRGAEFNITISRVSGVESNQLVVDDEVIKGNVIKNITAGRRYTVKVMVGEPLS